MVRKYGVHDRRGRADYGTTDAESALELITETFEQMDMFGFLAGELQKSPRSMVVIGENGTGMIENEGKNELFHQAKDIEIRISSNLIELEAFGRRQELQSGSSRQRFRHERQFKIERFVGTDDIFHAPVDFFRCCQGSLIVVIARIDVSDRRCN